MNSLQDLKLNRKYYPLSLDSFIAEYNLNEDGNKHDLNVVLCAYFAGSSVDLYQALALLQEGEANQLTVDFEHQRLKLMEVLSPKVAIKADRLWKLRGGQ